jgi:hypothetical protein
MAPRNDAHTSNGRSPVRPPRAARLTSAMALLGAVMSSECSMGDTGSIYFVTPAGKKSTKPPIPCAGDGQCPPSQPYCDPVSHICIQCLADPNCSGGKPFCGPGGACVECFADSGCDKGKPFCDLERLACIECLNDAHCSPGKMCHPISGRCVPSCVDSRDCQAMTPYCDTTRRLCVQCIADGNCVDAKKPICAPLVGDCVACTANAHCGEAHPLCSPLTYQCED